jgi:hypothetical protein
MRLSLDRHDLRLEFADEARRDVSIFLRFANVGFGTAESLAARFHLPPGTLVSAATIRLDRISGVGALLELPFASEDDGRVRCTIDNPIAPGDEALIILAVRIPDRLHAANLAVTADLIRPNGEIVLDEISAELHVEVDSVVDERLSGELHGSIAAITRTFDNKSRIPLPVNMLALRVPSSWVRVDCEPVWDADMVDAGDRRSYVERFSLESERLSRAGFTGLLNAAAPWIPSEWLSASVVPDPVGFTDVTCVLSDPTMRVSDIRTIEVTGVALGAMRDGVLTVELPAELAVVPGSRTFDGRPLSDSPPRSKSGKSALKGSLELAVPLISAGPFRFGFSVVALPLTGASEVSAAGIALGLVGGGQSWAQSVEISVKREALFRVSTTLDKAPVIPVGGILPFNLIVANAGTFDQPLTLEILLDDVLELSGLDHVQTESLRSTRQQRHRITLELDGQTPRELTAALRMSPDAHEGDRARVELSWTAPSVKERVVTASETIRACAAPALRISSRLNSSEGRPADRVTLHLRIENGGQGVAESSRVELSLPTLLSVERHYGVAVDGEIPALAPGAVFEAAYDLRLHPHRPGAMSHSIYTRLVVDGRDVAVVRNQFESAAIVSWDDVSFAVKPLSSTTRDVVAGDSLVMSFTATNGGDAIATRVLVGLVGETEFELAGDAWLNDVRLDEGVANELAGARGSIALENVGPGEKLELRLTVAARADRLASRTLTPTIALVSSGERVVAEAAALTILTPAQFRRKAQRSTTESATMAGQPQQTEPVTDAALAVIAGDVITESANELKSQIVNKDDVELPAQVPAEQPAEDAPAAASDAVDDDEAEDDEAADETAVLAELPAAAAVTSEMSSVAPFLRLRLQRPPSDAILPLLDSLLSATSRGVYRHTLAARFLIADSVDFGGAETIAQRRAILASLEIVRDAVTAGPVTIFKIVPLSDADFVATEDYVLGLEDQNLRASVERLLGNAIEALAPMTTSVDQPYGALEVRLDQREIEEILSDLQNAPVGAPAIARALASMIPGASAPGGLPAALHDYRVLLRQTLAGLHAHTDLLADSSEELETALALVVEHIRDVAAARANR